MPNPWEMDWQTSRAPGAMGNRTVVVGPADPNRQATMRGTNVRTDIDAAQLPYAGGKAAADLRKANADAAKAERDLVTTPPVDPKVAERIKALGLDDILSAIRESATAIKGGRATGYTGALLRTVGMGTSANDLTGSLETIKSKVTLDQLAQLKQQSSTGASGLGALTGREGDMLASSIASLDLTQSDDKLLASLAKIQRHALSLKAIQAGENPDDAAVAKKYGIVLPGAKAQTPPGQDKSSQMIVGPGKDGNGGGGLALAKGNVRVDPATAAAMDGVKTHLSSMVRKGASQTDIDAYTDSIKVPRFDARASIKFRDEHPEYKGGFSVVAPPQGIPMSPLAVVGNTIAQSGPGVAMMGLGDMVSGGTLDNMTSNPGLARAIMGAGANEHPNWNLAGQTAGGVLAGLTGEALLKRAGAGGMAATIGGDVIPGAAYGAGSTDDGKSRLMGAATGGAAGLAGGVIGRGMGRAVAGITDPATRLLADAKVRMTPGQVIGGPVKALEDRLAGLPGIGDIIRPQRVRGMEDFNRAAFQEASPAITDIGQSGVQQARQAVGDAYGNALNGKAVQIDGQLGTDLGDALTGIRAVPRVGEEVAQTVEDTLPPYFSPGGTLTGENMQPMLQELGALKGGYAGDPLGYRVGKGIAKVEDSITGMMNRQAPEVMPAYNAAKYLHAQKETLKNAVLSAEGQGGTFTPLQLARSSINGTKRFGGSDAAAVGDRPFNDLTQAGQEILPSKIPDSGTAGRAMLIPGALGFGGGAIGGGRGYADSGEGDGMSGTAKGAGAGAIAGIGAGAALASPYVLRGLIQKALTANRPDIAVQLGNALGQSRLPGALALPQLLSEGN